MKTYLYRRPHMNGRWFYENGPLNYGQHVYLTELRVVRVVRQAMAGDSHDRYCVLTPRLLSWLLTP